MTGNWARKARRIAGLDAVGFLLKRRDASNKSRKLQNETQIGGGTCSRPGGGRVSLWMFAADIQAGEQEVG